jgi:hypothetical protein
MRHSTLPRLRSQRLPKNRDLGLSHRAAVGAINAQLRADEQQLKGARRRGWRDRAALRGDPGNNELLGRTFLAVLANGEADEGVKLAERVLQVDKNDTRGSSLGCARSSKSSIRLRAANSPNRSAGRSQERRLTERYVANAPHSWATLIKAEG